jgi:catechol 2,3-dioxygenase-like lactoylglutathione lyase family enzyme
MPKIFRIVYCEFSSTHLAEELAYYTQMLGATLTHTSPDGAHYLSLGVDHHNIVLRAGETSGLVVTGFQLGAATNLHMLEQEFSGLGLKPELKLDKRPGVAELLSITIAGFVFEFFSEIALPAPGFGALGIVPSRLGHIAILSPEPDKLVQFFAETLGFHTTDWFDGLATFLTCNYDHHTINIIGAPITKLHHIAFELRGGAHQYLASDQLAKANLPIVWGPSRHTAGHNYASYHFDPDHVLIELYTDMDIFLPDVGYFEPRPWHETLPLRPQVWPPSQFNAWQTAFAFDFATA